jgi:hypothetical protein
MMNIEYKIVQDWDVNAFENKVTKLLNDGWKCQGGVSMTISVNGGRNFSQAMIYQDL